MTIVFVVFSSCTNPQLPGNEEYKFPGIQNSNILEDGSVILSWDKAPTDDVSYFIYRREKTESFDFSKALESVNTTSYKHAAWGITKSYCFVVRFAKTGIVADDNENETCPDLPYISNFVGVKDVTSSDTGQVTVTWDASTEEGIKGYNIYVGEGFKTLVASVGSSNSSAIINNLAVDESFSFGVRILDKYGREDDNRNTKTAKIINNVAPTFEGIKTATQATGDSIKLTWLAASGSPKEYRVYGAQAAANATPAVTYTTPIATIVAPTTTTTISGLGDELAHGFVVRAVSSGGQEDKNVVQQNVVLPDVGAPVFSGLKTFSFSQGGAQLTWDAAVGETTKYRVYYKEGTASSFTFGSATIADVTAPSTGTTISGLLDNRDWTFAVRAFDSHNQADTNVVTKTVTAGDLTPAAFTGYVGLVALGETSLSIEFNRSVETDVSHYSIRIKRSGTADTFTEKTTASQVGSGSITKSITGLLPATSYDVLVKVIDTSNNPSNNTSFLTRATLDQTPPTFNGITSVAQKSTDASKAVVTWAAASDAGGVAEYRVYYSRTTLVGQSLVRTGTFPSGSGNATIYMSNAVTSGTSLEIPGLTEGVVYYFVVHAIDNTGNEETNTAQAAYTVPYYTPPQPPTGLSIVGGNGPSTNRSPFINFSSTAGYTVKVYVNGTFNVSKAVNATGADTIQLAILPNTSGSYVVTMSHVNQSSVEGNTATVATYVLFVDIPTASLSGTPTSSMSASALAVTVSNASNVTHYKHSIFNNQTTTCANATYSPTWIEVATAITDSLNADGAWRLCVIAKNSSNLEQDPASATQVDFTRDTAPPAAPASLSLLNPITNSTTITYTPLVNATVASVAGASHYCVTPTNVAPASGDACWTASTSTTVTLTGNNAYAWAKKVSGAISTSAATGSITYTNICNSGSLATGQTCTISSAKTVNDGDVIAGQGNMVITSSGSITGNATERFTISLNGNFTANSGGGSRIAGNVTINANNITISGVLSADGKGYQGVANAAGTPGSSGGGISASYGGGGGHAGSGGSSSGGLGSAGQNNASLNASQPVTFGGSGGGAVSISTSAPGSGGGAIKLNATAILTIDGTVSANGTLPAHNYGGAGAGGSIWILAGSIAGTGNIFAKGATTSAFGGDGSGGAISMTSTNAFKGSVNVDAGGLGYGSVAENGKLTTNFSNPCDIGSLSGDCTISGPVTMGAGQSLTVSGNLVLASGGVLKTVAKLHSLALSVGGDITVQNGGSILANLSSVSCVNFTIDNGGTVSANGLGYFGNNGGSNSVANSGGAGGQHTYGAAGGGHGGRGGLGQYAIAVSNGSYTGGSYIGGAAHGSASAPVTFGGAGGQNYQNSYAGSPGGGAIKISATGTLTVNGTLSANGLNGQGTGSSSNSSGGAAGGSIWLDVVTLSGTGTISADGGNGGASSLYTSGGGAGGRIAAYNTNKFSGTVRASAGLFSGAMGNTTDGEVGTVYFPNNVDNYCNIGTFATGCTINQVWGIPHNVTISKSGDLTIANGGKLYSARSEAATLTATGGTITVQSGGAIIGNFTINSASLVVDSGGSINADQWGNLAALNSNGAGTGGSLLLQNNNGVGGAAHGGAGGNGVTSGGSASGTGSSTTYGSATSPTTWGSAGGSAGCGTGALGGSGGGAIKISVSGTATVNGTISANGGNAGPTITCTAAGGGSGGSVWIIASTLAGAGSVTVNGGLGGNYSAGVGGPGLGGGGGGGRISVTRSTDTFSGTRTANGGGPGTGGPGTPTAGSSGTVSLQ